MNGTKTKQAFKGDLYKKQLYKAFCGSRRSSVKYDKLPQCRKEIDFVCTSEHMHSLSKTLCLWMVHHKWSPRILWGSSWESCWRWAVTGDMKTLSRISAGHKLLWQQRCWDIVVTQPSQDLWYTHAHTRFLNYLNLLIPMFLSFSFLPHAYYFTSVHLFHRLSHKSSHVSDNTVSHTLTHWWDSALLTKINSNHSQRRCLSGKSVVALFTWINSF